MLKRTTILLVVFLITHSLLGVEINNRIFNQVFSNDYQARQSFSIIKSNDGFIWVVNGYGVSRYDGKKYKNYVIKNDWRGFIKKSKAGDLYVCTYKGIAYKYNHFTDTFDEVFSIFVNNQIPDSILKSKINQINKITSIEKSKNKTVTSMDIDQFGRIWLSTPIAVLCYDPTTKTWLDLNTGDFNATFLMVENKKLYIFGKEKICTVELTKELQKRQRIHTLLTLNANNEITTALYDTPSGNLYYGTYNKGLFCLNPHNELSQLLVIKNSPIRSLKMYDQLLLIGIDGLGIYEYNTDSKVVESIQSVNINQPDALGSNGIFDMYVDENKRIWVATNSKGLNVYNPGLLYFKSMTHLTLVDNSLIHNNINSIYEDNKQNLWIGTNNGISIWNKKSEKWTHVLNNKSVVNRNAGVFSLCGDKNGNVWVGMYGFGLASVNSENYSINSFELINSNKESLNNFFFKLHFDGETVWGGGAEINLFNFNPVSKRLTYFDISNVKSIEKVDDSNLWVLSGSKISLFNKNSGRQNFALQKKINNHFNTSQVEYSCMKRDGNNLWIGTLKSGIIRYSYSTNSVDYFTIKNGLPSNNILSIEIDNSNCLWFSTDIGLCYFNPGTKISLQFKTLNVPEKNVFNSTVSYKCMDGTMVFGTKQGAVSFHPSEFLVTPLRGPLAWTEFSVYNQNKNKRTVNEILGNELNKLDEIILRHGENSFNIGFQELNYNKSIYTRYSYLLSGFEKEFSDMSIENSVSYYNLSPGIYHLIVRSYFADKDGKYIEREMKIEVLQPWYNTIWAWLIWISIFISIAYSVYRYYHKRMERKNSDDKIKFFINVSHDMRTPITLIKAPLGDLVNDKNLPSSSRYLVHTINNNVNRLFDMINRILDFEKSDENEMRLFPQDYELNKYVQDVVENFHSYADIKGVSIEEQTLNEPVWVNFDRIKMDMVVENLVSNAIKYSKQGGTVRVIAGYKKNEWWIEIEDNGIGIPADEQKKIFKRFFRAENAINSKQIGSGMGLLLVNNLTRFMGGNVMFESKENIRTIFRISFPLNLEVSKHALEADIKSFDTPIENNELETASLLFVDDNDEIRDYISTRLAADFKIYTAASAHEALNILFKNKINIIISDIMMPKISGIELCERIKADIRFSHIPFILLSALSDKKDILKGLQIGADDYITKPFDSEFLKQRVDNILENRKRQELYFLNNKGEVSQLAKQEFVNELDKLFLEKLQRIFDANISDSEYTIESLCRDMGMSRSVLYNRFKNLTDVSPNDYLRIRRMEKAAELLLTKKYSVVEVAEMVGYNDVKYFSSLFSKKYGSWPSKYMG